MPPLFVAPAPNELLFKASIEVYNESSVDVDMWSIKLILLLLPGRKKKKKKMKKKRMKTESESFGQNNTSYSIYIKKNYLYSILSNQ